jgi:hypothetical protein
MSAYPESGQIAALSICPLCAQSSWAPLLNSQQSLTRTPESLFSLRSSAILHDVLACEDVLSSGASVEENHHGNQEEEKEIR